MRVGPTSRFVVLLLLGATAAFVLVLMATLPVGIVFGTLIVVAVLLAISDTVGASSHSLVTVTRRHPPVMVLGADSRIEWDIRSDAKRPLRVVIAEPLAPSLRADTRRFAVTVPAASTVEVSTGVRPSRRGRFDLDHMTVRLVGRFGLMTRQRDVPVRSVVRVHPRFASAAQAELRLRDARLLQVGTRTVSGLGGGTDFEQLREYVVDDEYRHIDWTATARVGRPVVRTYRAEKNQYVMVLLDGGRVQAGLVAGAPRVEYSMDASMMLATIATGLGDHCGLVAFNSRIRSVLTPGRGRGQVSRMAEAMFDLEPELAESDYAGAFSYTVSRFRRRMMIVVLTDIVDQAISGALIPALPTLTRKHIVVVAAVRDPRLVEWAGGGGQVGAGGHLARAGDGAETDGFPDGLPDGLQSEEERVARRLAAIETLATRRVSVARLRSMGAIVIDAPPHRLASELGDVYLRIKGAGRL